MSDLGKLVEIYKKLPKEGRIIMLSSANALYASEQMRAQKEKLMLAGTEEKK